MPKYTIQNPNGTYFITCTTVQWVDVFTRNIYRDEIVNSLNYCIKNKGLIIYAWVVMSNHIHLIAAAKEGYHLGEIVRDFKKHTSKKLIELIKNESESRRSWITWIFKTAGEENSNNVNYQFWQQNTRSIELHTREMVEQRLEYTHQNPVKSGWVAEDYHYLYSSAVDYSGGKGMVDIVHI